MSRRQKAEAQRDRYREALERIVRRAEEPCGAHEAPLPYDVAWAEQVAIAREALDDRADRDEHCLYTPATCPWGDACADCGTVR